MSLDSNQKYLYIAQQLKQQGLFSKLISKTWEKRPKNLKPEEEILWFRTELIARGYIAEHILAEIPNFSEVIQVPEERKKFGRFTLLEEIGKGGMGTVYRAFDPSLNKNVALKMLKIKSSDAITKRFISEAQIMAQLHHPNIVKFYEVNQFQKQYYLTMEYIEGDTLRKWIISHKPHQSISTDIMLKICWAVQQVHQCGIVHRDLKPENIVINEDGEPVIMDFGIAKNRDMHFSTVNILGTPNYMSPEQAQGKEIDFRSDVFALGIIFYEMLTGRLPFVGESDFEIFSAIVHQEPVSPKLIQPNLHSDLETICLKCLEKDCSKRYQCVQELAEDIQRFQNNEPIVAKPISFLGRSIKWVQRNKLTTIVASLSFVIVAALLGVYIISLREFSLQNQTAARKTKLHLAKIALSKAKVAYQNSQWRQSGVLAGVCLESILELQGSDVDELKQHSKELLRLNLLKHSLLWEKPMDGMLGDNRVFRVGKTFRIYDIDTEKEVMSFPHPDPSYTTPYRSPSGNLLALNLPDKLQIWDISSQKPILNIDSGSHEYHVIFSPHDKYVAIKKEKFSMFSIWDIKNSQKIAEFSTSDRGVGIFNRRETMFAYNRGHDVFVYDLNTKTTQRLDGHENIVCALAFIDDQRLISTTVGGTVRTWWLKSEKPIFSVPDKGTKLAVSKSGEMFASSFGNKVFVWDSNLGRIIQTYNTNHENAADMRFIKEDQQIMCFYPNKVSCWRIFYCKQDFVLDKSSLGGVDIDSLALIEINHDSSLLSYLPRNAKRVQLWNIQTQQKIAEVEHPDIATDFQFSQSQNIAVTACRDGHIRLWKNNELQSLYHIGKQQTSLVRFHPREENIIAFTSDKTLFLYNHSTKKIVRLDGHQHNIAAIAFSHDGSMLASAGHETLIWDVKTQKIIQKPPYAHSEYRPQLDFSAKNDILMVCDFRYVYFWDIQNSKERYRKNIGDGNSCIFSPFYNEFIQADFRYRLIETHYGYTIQDFYAGWLRTWNMVSKADGTFAVCLTGNVIVLKLPPVMYYQNQRLPEWHNKFRQANPLSSYSTPFDLRPDVPGWFIESALQESPQLLSELLFDLKINEDLTFD